MEFPALHVYSMQRLCERRFSNKVWWNFRHYMSRTWTLWFLTKTLKHLRVSSAGKPYNQAVQKLMISILNESPVVHFANSVVFVCVLIPLDVNLSRVDDLTFLLSFPLLIDFTGLDHAPCGTLHWICLLNFIFEVPCTICLLFALFCLSIRLSDHHGLQIAF